LFSTSFNLSFKAVKSLTLYILMLIPLLAILPPSNW